MSQDASRLPGHLVAVLLGQRDVAEHHVVGAGPDGLDGVGAVVGEPDDVAALSREHGQCVGPLAVVLDYQHGERAREGRQEGGHGGNPTEVSDGRAVAKRPSLVGASGVPAKDNPLAGRGRTRHPFSRLRCGQQSATVTMESDTFRRLVVTNDEEALLQAIRDDPEDDAPRLVYADWLEEHRQPERAEFIRVQCELAGCPAEPGRLRELQERESALLNAHEKSWLEPLARILDPSVLQTSTARVLKRLFLRRWKLPSADVLNSAHCPRRFVAGLAL